MKAGCDAWRRLCRRQVTPTITGGLVLAEDIVLKAAVDNKGTPVSAASLAPVEKPDLFTLETHQQRTRDVNNRGTIVFTELH